MSYELKRKSIMLPAEEKRRNDDNGFGKLRRDWKIYLTLAMLISSGSIGGYRLKKVEAIIEKNLSSDTTDHERILMLENNYEHIKDDLGDLKGEVEDVKTEMSDMKALQWRIIRAVEDE